MVQEGRKAPAFTLDSADGDKLGLKDLAGQWVVLYFYPKDNTPGCTTEAKDFTAALGEFEQRNATVVGVSRDSVKSHCGFRDKHGLEIRLLSDPDGQVHEKYGAWGEKNAGGKKGEGPIRTTVLIDPDGKVRKIWPKVKVNGHADEVLETLDELQGA